jgi:hypothetical protein
MLTHICYNCCMKQSVAIEHDQPARIAALSPAAQKTVDHYAGLRLGAKKVVTPYFMNPKGRKGRRVSVGKGSPEDLERETRRLAKRYRFDLNSASVSAIRQFMIKQRLGIDCSGFVAWSLYADAMENHGLKLWSRLHLPGHPLRTKLVKLLRPVENISVKVLTSAANADTISDLRQVLPGDVIRSLNGNHILLISEVGYNKSNEPLYVKYMHSTEHGGKPYGILKGKIIVTKPTGNILQQRWLDAESGRSWIFNAANNFPDDTHIARLKLFASLDKSS